MKYYKIGINTTIGMKLYKIQMRVIAVQKHAASRKYQLLFDTGRHSVVGYVLKPSNLERSTFSNDTLKNMFDVKKRKDFLLLKFSSSPSGRMEAEKLQNMGPFKFVYNSERNLISISFDKIGVDNDFVFVESQNDIKLDDFQSVSRFEYLTAKNNSKIDFTEIKYDL